MIAIESFKRFNLADIATIIVLAVFAWAFSFAANIFLGMQVSYIASLLITTAMMALSVHVVRKAGSVTIFYLFNALLTYNLNDFGVMWQQKIISFLIAGILFEATFLVLKLELKEIQLDIIIGTALSAASIPLTIALQLSLIVTGAMIKDIINLMLLSFFVGIIGSIIAFFIWYKLRATKFMLRRLV